MNILDFLSCEYPIMQAGMADISRSQLTSAVSLAGGVGTIGLSPPAQFEVDILDTKEKVGSRTYAVNLLMPFVTKTHIAVCVRNRVPIVVMFFGYPKNAIEILKESGALVIVQIGSLAEADRVMQLGVDGLIIQGNEAGGHVRGDEKLASILPVIRSKYPNVPLIAAGGIHDRATTLAAYNLGADAVCCGTRFLMTPESFAHEEYKHRLVAAKSTVLTNLFGVSWPDKHRVIPNQATQKWTREGEIPAWLKLLHRSSTFLAKLNSDTRKLVSRQTLKLPIYTPAPLKPGMDADAANVTALYAGECVAEIHEHMSAADVVKQLTA